MINFDEIRVENFIAAPDEPYAAKIWIDSEKGVFDNTKGVFVSLPVMRNSKPAVFNVNCSREELEYVFEVLDFTLFDETYKNKLEQLETELFIKDCLIEQLQEENEALHYRKAAAL